MDQATANVVIALCVISFLCLMAAILLEKKRQRSKENISGVVKITTPQETQAIDDVLGSIDDALGLVLVTFRLNKQDVDVIRKLADRDKLAYAAKLRQLVLRSLLAELEQKKLGIPTDLPRRLAELDQKEQSSRE